MDPGSGKAYIRGGPRDMVLPAAPAIQGGEAENHGIGRVCTSKVVLLGT
jgi:hypothetical protein